VSYNLHAQKFEGLVGPKLLAKGKYYSVLSSSTGIQVDQSTCQRAFADGFHDEPAGNILAVSDHTRDA